MAADDILRGEGKVTKGTTYDCILVHPILNLETVFKRRIKWRVSLFCTHGVGSGPVATLLMNTQQLTSSGVTEEKYT